MLNQPVFGFHYDIARGAYLKPDMFCRALRLAAESGYTHFFPYLENMIRLPSMAKACPSCAYTTDDWRRFEAVAKEASIELVPHFNVIGHTENICLAYPELGGAVDRGHLDVDPERPVTQEWMLRCLAEFCEFSHSNYFLIGGDEWQPPRHLLARPDFDTGQVWVNQINRAIEFLARQGRKPVIWHDMLVHFPATLAQLSRKAVIAFWFYDVDSDYPVLDTFKQLGFETWMATAVLGHPARLTHRAVGALRCAARAAEKHHTDGIMVTTWEECRWELESLNIPAAADILRGGNPASAILDALSLTDFLLKLPADGPVTNDTKARILRLLDDPAWEKHPDLRRSTRAIVTGNPADDAGCYTQFHYSQGRIYERIGKKIEHPTWPARPTAVKSQSFGLTTEVHPQAGTILRFLNDAESFDVYPKFGASLQNWQVAGQVVILSGIERFLESHPQPGGYRSYTAAGGFRPIWALGTHSNPCILWQFPYEWKVIEQTTEKIMVELARDFSHAGIRLRIGIERGQSGFIYEAHAVNKLEHTYGAFSFNIPLAFGVEDLAGMKFCWDGKTTTTAVEAKSVFVIPAAGPLTVEGTKWTLHIEADPARTAFYFVDWGAGCITPDLHGVYQKLKVGEETITRWRFAIERQVLPGRM